MKKYSKDQAKKFGKFLRKWRVDNGLKIEAAASLLDIHVSTYYNYEEGNSFPSFCIEKLLAFFERVNLKEECLEVLTRLGFSFKKLKGKAKIRVPKTELLPVKKIVGGFERWLDFVGENKYNAQTLEGEE